MSKYFYKIWLCAISLLLSVSAWTQTADVNKGCSPLTVNFTAPAGSTSWYWDFKDGGSSNIQNPSNIFTSPGTYLVEFRNTPNGPVVGSVQVVVWPKPDVVISATPETGCVPLTVQFQDNSTFQGDIQILNRSWVFGDGGSAGNFINPTHLYNTAGNFAVSLELTTNYPSCNITALFADKVKTAAKPTATFTTTPNPAQSCTPPLTVTIANNSTGQAPLSYNWNFGNGNTSTLANPPAQTYTQTGIFPIKLKVTNILGCIDSSTVNVRIGAPKADFYAADTTPCLNKLVAFINTSDPGLYLWNFGPNAIPATSTFFNPTVKFTATGPQTVTLTVTSAGGCIGVITKTIVVDQADASFTMTPNYSCFDPAAIALNATSPAANFWQWSFPYFGGSSIKTPTYTWSNPDTTGYTSLGPFKDSIQLIVGNPSGCRDTLKQLLTIWPPNARFMPNIANGCGPLAVTFADSSFSNEPIVQWTWLFGDGSPNLVQTNGNNVNHTYTQPGEYEVRLIIRNSAGCIDTSYAVVIEVGAPLTADFTVDQTVLCPGDTVQFNALITDPRIDAWHFYSDNNRQWHCAQDQNPLWVYNAQAGVLDDVSLMVEYNGCFNTLTKNDLLTLNGPIARLHYKTTCENSLSFDFTDESTGATAVSWNLGDGTTSTLPNLTHVYDSAGTYQVILTAVNTDTGCPISTDTATVYATQLQADFELPYYICGGQEYQLDGIASTDVNASCYKGYTWYFSFQRPIRTDEGSIPFIFPESGPQTVALEVQDINGCLDTIRQDIKVFFTYPKFEVSDTLICRPGTVQFFDQSTADTTLTGWSWDFGDLTPPVTDQNPTHTFTNPPPAGADHYTVTLTVTDKLGCSHQFSREIKLYTPISNIFVSPSANTCVGNPVTFVASDFAGGGSSLSWQWSFGDGGTATGQSAAHTYLAHGTYTVTLTYTEIGSGCMGTALREVNAQSYPQAAFTTNVDNQSIICYPQNIQLTNTSVTDYALSTTWNLGNGQLTFGNNAATVFPKGTWTVTMVTATSYGCSDTTQRTFTVVGPEGTFEMDKTFICLGDVINFNLKDTVDISSFSWSFGDGTTADNINPVSHAYDFFPPSGSTVAKLILRGEDDACSFTVSKVINFSKINAAFSVAQTPVCFGAEHEFVNNSTEDDLWQWNFGDGTTDNTEAPSHEYDAVGDYTVTLIVTDQPLGCKDTLTQVVNVAGLPNFEAVGATVCAGDTAMIGLLQPVPGATYTWTPANTVLNPKNQATVKVSPTATTIYTVSVVVDSSGCMDSDTALVFVPGMYPGAQNLDTLVEKGQPVMLPVTLTPGYIFTWEPSNPGPSLTVTPQDSSLHYTLTVTDPYGCVESVFEFHVRVFPQNLRFPNAFTPGNDENNEVFTMIPDGERGLIDINYLKIYSRWGQLIYEGSGTDATVGWDGNYQGKPAPVDVYIWKASATYKTGRVEMFTGEVTLIR